MSDNLRDLFACDVSSIQNAVVKITHDGDLGTLFFNQFRIVVCGRSTLPNVDTHVDHVFD